VFVLGLTAAERGYRSPFWGPTGRSMSWAARSARDRITAETVPLRAWTSCRMVAL
jgi:hypothetical protein